MGDSSVTKLGWSVTKRGWSVTKKENRSLNPPV